MFTGLIEAIGVVSRLEPVGPGFRLQLRTTLATELKSGESIAVNGCCLTVTGIEDGDIQADIGAEAGDLPVVAAAGVGLSQPHDVTEGEIEDRVSPPASRPCPYGGG